jgi:hypothetical protein
MIFLSSLTLYNTRWFKYDRDYLCVNKSQFVPVIFEPPCTSPFLTWSVQLIFSILLQQHTSKLSRHFWSTFQSVQFSAPYNAMPQM